MEAKQKIESLRSLISHIEGFKNREHFSFSQFEGGFPQGALVEISGAGKTQWMAEFLSENPQLPVAWIEEDLSIFPPALSQHHARPERILFIEAGTHALWAAHQVLRSGLFKIIALSKTKQNDQELRKLQLASEKGDCTVIILSESSRPAWPISVQVRVSRVDDENSLHREVLKARA